MQIQYIGKCSKQDSIRGVGLHWEPGQVRNVSLGVAERLLPFKDTWVRIGESTGEEIGLISEEKPTEEPLPVIDFHAMDKAAIVEFVSREYNEKLDKRLSTESLRHKAIALFGQHQADLVT
jgi:hypothetical protein